MKGFFGLIRWDDWYDSKMALFFLVYYYLLLVKDTILLQDMILLLPLGLFFISLASFGFTLNDYFDKSIDKVSGKQSILSSIGSQRQVLVLCTLLLFGLISFIPFYQYKFAVVFLLLSYISSILYSAYPFRLKEKGIWGIICVSLAQWVFPALIVFGIFKHFAIDTLLWVIFLLLLGLRWVLVHQLIDWSKDIRTDIMTFAVIKTPIGTLRIMRFLFAFELISLLSLLAVISINTTFMVLFPVIAYFIFGLYLYSFWNKLGLKYILSSYEFSPFADLYFFWYPLWFSILLGCLNHWFFIITVLEILWKKDYLKSDIKLIILRRNCL